MRNEANWQREEREAFEARRAEAFAKASVDNDGICAAGPGTWWSDETGAILCFECARGCDRQEQVDAADHWNCENCDAVTE